MVAGHTPGPWRAIEFADGGEVVDSDGYEVADLNTGLIAINRHWLDEHDEHWSGHAPESYIERTQEEVDANAALIAASTAMYAALVTAEDALFAQAVHFQNPDRARVQAALEVVRAALSVAASTAMYAALVTAEDALFAQAVHFQNPDRARVQAALEVVRAALSAARPAPTEGES
jgi:hypothetical protein